MRDAWDTGLHLHPAPWDTQNDSTWCAAPAPTNSSIAGRSAGYLEVRTGAP